MKKSYVIVFGLAFALVSGLSQAQASKVDPKEEHEALTQKYVEDFKKSGIPNAAMIESALKKANESNLFSDWQIVAIISNSYANVLGALKDNYSTAYNRTRREYGGSHPYLEKAAAYERQQNNYLEIRNDAYIKQAQIKLMAGDKSEALGLALTSLRLSGDQTNEKAEDLIKRLIEYK